MSIKSGSWTTHVTIHANAAGAGTFTNMPTADTFLFSSHRHVTLVDVTGMTYVRLKVNKQATAAPSGAKLILRYNSTFSTTASDYSSIGTSEVSVGIDVTNQHLDSGWVELDPSALSFGDIYLAVIGNGGNGTLDPAFGSIGVSFC